MRAKSLQKLTDELKARHSGIVIWGVGDDAHKTRYSDHNEDDTAGSKAAQSDPDSIPEHRAIDVMLGPAFSRNQARALIPEILANANNRKRLRYINFENTQWHRNNNFAPAGNSDDPHPDHIHFSGQAAEDDNTAPWLSGGTDVLTASRGMGSAIAPHDNVLYLQRKMAFLIPADDPRLADHPLVVDGVYGGNTAYWVSVLLTGGSGDVVNGAWFAVLDEMNADKKIADAIGSIGGQLPASVTFDIPAQTVTVPLHA